MPEKLYTKSDMGGGLQVINSLDPVNLQDLATKNYVDTYRSQFGPYVPLWETDYSMQCGTGNFSNNTFHLTTGPTDQTITKLYPDTAILVTGTISCYVTNTISALVRLQCSVAGGSILDVCGLNMSTTGEHHCFPVGMKIFPGTGGPGSYLGSVTGSLGVAWYLYVSNATSNIATDPNDFASWTIAEVKTS